MADQNKYTCMENVLQHVNSNYICLDKNQIKINNKVINEVS